MVLADPPSSLVADISLGLQISVILPETKEYWGLVDFSAGFPLTPAGAERLAALFARQLAPLISARSSRASALIAPVAPRSVSALLAGSRPRQDDQSTSLTACKMFRSENLNLGGTGW